MAQQTINVGASPNDGTGTPLRTAFQYTNSNFSELYTATGPSGNNIVVPGSATITGDLTVATDRLKVVTGSTAIQTGATTQLQVGTTSWPSTVIGKSGSRSLFGNTGEVAIWNESAPAIGNYSTLFVTAKTGAGATTMGGLQIRAGIENASNSDGFVSLWTTNSVAGGFVERYKIDSTGVATWSNVGGVAGTAMTLNATGLGVGVASPAYKLDVSSSANIVSRFTSSNTGNTGVNIVNNSGTTWSLYNFGSSDANPGSFGIYHQNGTSFLQISPTGNVGIGVTPSAWGAGYKALQFGQSASVSGFSSELAVFGSNCYFDTTDSRWERITSGFTSQYYQTGGTHVWRIGGTAGANTDCAFTQAMTLDASGNLLVGTTTSGGVNGVTLQPSATTPQVVTVGTATTGGTAYLLYSTGATANRFYVTYAGTVFATNTTISAISDARFKENVQDIDVGLGAILALKPRKFDWKAGKGKDIKGDRGFIAQEFETVFPQLVDEWADPSPEGEAPYKSVRQDLIPVLVKAIQELTARVQTLEAK